MKWSRVWLIATNSFLSSKKSLIHGTIPSIMSYVITCGDDGVQINQGVRLGVVGAGVELKYFPEVVKALKKVVGQEICLVASAENDWIKQSFKLNDYSQADATMQQQAEALADREGLLYAGFLPFADPKPLKFELKGHMVRPKSVHIGNKISFTLGGGEQTYNLGNFVVSADWVYQAPKKVVKAVIETQVKFYQSLVSFPLKFVFEMAGELGEKVAAKNQKVLASIGIRPS